MKEKYMLIAHYVDSTATILPFNCLTNAFFEFEARKWHPDLAFVTLYSRSLTGDIYFVIDSYVSGEFRHSREFTLLGFSDPITPAGQK